MIAKKVKRVILAPDVMMGSTALKQPLPSSGLDQIGPFLLLHHVGPHTQEPGGKSALDIGGHPHRGFETVTFIFNGEVHHRDSRGNDQRIAQGGVQWMSAARGIVHSEGASKEFVEAGGEIEIIQLWVNLPSQLKMNQPRYQGYQKEDIASIKEDGFTINIISGNYNDTKGPIDSLTGITAYTIAHSDTGKISIDVTPGHTPLLYQLDGLSTVNGIGTGNHKMLHFDQEGDTIEITAESKGRILYVSGLPIDEPVVTHGPFVMNTQTEILEAMRDYQMGKMGILI